MSESKLVQLNFKNNSYSMFYAFSMLSLGCILIQDLVVTNLFMHSLRDMILLYLATSIFTPKVFLHEIILYKKAWHICT